jgi:hypothetical protein
MFWTYWSAFFLARPGVFAFSANTVTGKRIRSHPALAVWGGGREIVIGKRLFVIGQCNRALAGITFFYGKHKYL